MRKLMSMKDFERDALREEELLNTLGGRGGPSDSFSSRANHRGTMTSWNCTDTEVKLDTDWNGVWTHGLWETTCIEESNSVGSCPNTGFPNNRTQVS